MKKSFLFITCEEAFHICDKAQYGEASWWEKIKLNIRLLWCNITKAYVKKNRKLSKTIQEGHVNCMNNTEKNNLKQAFEKELHKQQ